MPRVNIKIEVLSTPSRSKGWARYACKQDGKPLLQTSTGNEWIGNTTKEGGAEAGSTITVISQVMLNVGKGGRARQEIDTQSYRLTVEEGVADEIEHRPGSQGQRLRITGARRAAFIV